MFLEADWEPTLMLRRFGVGDVLQQMWKQPQFNGSGHVIDWKYEWRAVPHVYGEETSQHG